MAQATHACNTIGAGTAEQRKEATNEKGQRGETMGAIVPMQAKKASARDAGRETHGHACKHIRMGIRTPNNGKAH
eukprot:3269555-Alexandrium_andersonii.AAC.1